MVGLKRFELNPWLGWVSLFNHQELIVSWTRRDLEGRFRGAYLGRLWAVLNPLLTLALYTVVFSVILKVRFGAGGHAGFAMYLMCGLLPWLAFSESSTRATTVILGNQNLVKKVVFPLATLPVSLVGTALINQVIGSVLLALVVAFTVGLHLTIIWIPLLLLIQTALMLGVCWFLASLGVFVRDVAQAIGLALNMGMYLTPIVYPASMVPEAYRWALWLNPIAFLVEGYRGVLLDGRAPAPLALVLNLTVALAVMVLGYLWFHKTQRAFADVL